MRIPGLWSVSPEVVAALWAGVGAGECPFRALQQGMDVWDASLSGDTALLSKVALEALEAGRPEVVGVVGELEAQGPPAVERVPRSQRLTAAIREWRGRYGTALEFLRAAEEAKPKAKGKGSTVSGPADEVMKAAASAQPVLVRIFQAVPAEQLGVLWAAVGRELEEPLVQWAWACGIARRVWGPGAATPGRVLAVLRIWVGESPERAFEALLLVRLMHTAPTVASHVMGRWLMQQIWGDTGLWGPVPDLNESFWLLLPEALSIEREVRTNGPVVAEGVAEMKQFGVDTAAPSGVGLSVAAVLERYERLVVAAPEVQEALLSDEDEALPDCPGETVKSLAWVKAQLKARETLDAKEDTSGQLGFDPYRTLLMTVTPEVATSAAEFVLRWRHHFFHQRLMPEPKGFVLSVEGWMVRVVARMEGLRTSPTSCLLDADTAYWRGYWGPVTQVAKLPDRRRPDWRIEEVLRPLIYAALSSMAAGLQVPNADQLYKHSSWVGTKIWRPTWSRISIYRALEVLFALSPKGIKGEVFGVWARELGVSEEELQAWVVAQPFDLAQLERFRRMVVAGDVELTLVGSLPETLYARPHVKPSWLTGPLLGLVEPRQLRDPLD